MPRNEKGNDMNKGTYDQMMKNNCLTQNDLVKSIMAEKPLNKKLNAKEVLAQAARRGGTHTARTMMRTIPVAGGIGLAGGYIAGRLHQRAKERRRQMQMQQYEGMAGGGESVAQVGEGAIGKKMSSDTKRRVLRGLSVAGGTVAGGLLGGTGVTGGLGRYAKNKAIRRLAVGAGTVGGGALGGVSIASGMGNYGKKLRTGGVGKSIDEAMNDIEKWGSQCRIKALRNKKRIKTKKSIDQELQDIEKGLLARGLREGRRMIHGKPMGVISRLHGYQGKVVAGSKPISRAMEASKKIAAIHAAREAMKQRGLIAGGAALGTAGGIGIGRKVHEHYTNKSISQQLQDIEKGILGAVGGVARRGLMGTTRAVRGVGTGLVRQAGKMQGAKMLRTGVATTPGRGVGLMNRLGGALQRATPKQVGIGAGVAAGGIGAAGYMAARRRKQQGQQG